MREKELAKQRADFKEKFIEHAAKVAEMITDAERLGLDATIQLTRDDNGVYTAHPKVSVIL